MDLDIPNVPPPAFSFFADRFYERLQENLSELQEELDEDEQLLVLFHTPGETIAVESFGYHNPTLLIVYGKDSDGRDCTIFSNVAAVQVVVKAVAAEEDEPKRIIGFVGEVGE